MTVMAMVMKKSFQVGRCGGRRVYVEHESDSWQPFLKRMPDEVPESVGGYLRPSWLRL
jgi:hypothetical protein